MSMSKSMQKSTPAKRYSPELLGTPCWRSYIYYFICFSCMNLSVLWDCIVCVSSIIFSLLVVLLVSSAEQNYLEKQQHSNHTCVKRFNIKKTIQPTNQKLKYMYMKKRKKYKILLRVKEFKFQNSSFKHMKNCRKKTLFSVTVWLNYYYWNGL